MIRRALGGAHILAFIPVLTLGAYWAGGEMALLVTALAIPIVMALMGGLSNQSAHGFESDPLTGLILRDSLIDWAEIAVPDARNTTDKLRSL